MSSTVNEAWASFQSNLEVPHIQTERLLVRQEKICEVLQQKITCLNEFISGSYVRSTMIAPLKAAEIDFFVVLDSHYFHHFNNKRRGIKVLVRMVHWALNQTYRRPVINRNGRSVTVWFSDYGVCVVPVMLRLGGGFVIPNALTQSWISTDPTKHDRILKEADEAHHQMLVPLIRMIKAWNRCSGSFFTSFHLEVLALEVLNGATIADFPSGVRLFFDRARDAVAGSTPDPAGFDNDIADYLGTPGRISEAKKRLAAAYEIASRAERQDTKSEHTANHLWRQLFSNYFPESV